MLTSYARSAGEPGPSGSCERRWLAGVPSVGVERTTNFWARKPELSALSRSSRGAASESTKKSMMRVRGLREL